MNSLHYPSLELCKKLTEDGFPETEKTHILRKNNDGGLFTQMRYIVDKKQEKREGVYIYERFEYVCPSVMELLDEMPKSILVNILGKNEQGDFPWIIRIFEEGKQIGFTGTFPNALAEMWLWLKENNYLTK